MYTKTKRYYSNIEVSIITQHLYTSSLTHYNMKEIRIVFEDDDYNDLLEVKERYGLTWREFFLTLIKPKKEVKR